MAYDETKPLEILQSAMDDAETLAGRVDQLAEPMRAIFTTGFYIMLAKLKVLREKLGGEKAE